jgi:TolA-binding protein
MSKEHSERILQLQTRLEYMNIEAEKQRTSLLQQKNKERERLDKIAEVKYFPIFAFHYVYAY